MPWSLCLGGWCALLVRVLIGSGYLHALNLVSLVRAGSCALLVRVVRVPGWKWLPAYLEPRVPGSCGSYPGWKWLPAYLEPCVLGWCALLVRILIGSDYLHALNLVSLVRALLVGVLVGSGYLHTLNLVSWFVS